MDRDIQIEFHNVANLFPMMNATELESLKQDISTNGLREPIWLYQNKIIDGRNRYIACLESGIEPVFRNYDGNENDLIDFVISLNLHRRHLNTSQKACLAVEILPEIEKRTKENLSKKMSAIRKGQNEVSAKLQKLNSSQTASKIFGVSERYIFDAKKLQKESIFLFYEVRQGKFTLQQAKKLLVKPMVSAKLQKANTTDIITNENVVLSSTDLRKISELVKELEISEHKAREYVINQKLKRKPRVTNINIKELKEIKVRIPQQDKDKLQLIAKQRHITVSDFLRELLNNNVFEVK